MVLDLIKDPISIELLYIIITIPLATLFIAINRYIIGMRGYSMYVPLTLIYTLLFFNKSLYQDNIVLNITIYLSYVFSIFIANSIASGVISRFSIHYISKINLGIYVSLGVLVIYILLIKSLSISVNFYLTLFSLLIVAFSTEIYSKFLTKSGFGVSLRSFLESMLISLIIFFIISFPLFQTTYIKYFWIVVPLMLLNLIIGLYKGLRVSEYFRFSSIMESSDESDKNN